MNSIRDFVISTNFSGSIESVSGFIHPVQGGSKSAGTWAYPGGGMHLGLDWAAPIGTTVVAPASGVILYAAAPVGSNSGYLGNWSGYPYGGGNTIEMLCNVNDTLYAVSFCHLSQTIYVSAGQSVSQGQAIALSGNSGNSSGPHTHVEVYNLGSMSVSDAVARFSAGADFAWGTGWSGTGTSCEAGKAAPCRKDQKSSLVRRNIMIDLKDVSKAYPNGVHALNHVNLHIDKGEFVYVIGATGSGKSTLIKVLNGEEVPDEGTVIVDGINVGALKHRKVPYYRRNVGCVFQDYRLLPKLTVFENIAFALEVVGMPRKQIRKRVMEVLELVDLKEKARSYPDELSGGQQQRVTIGRAIANKPKVLIADEPTGNLDPEKSLEIISLLEKINQKLDTTIMMVTHDKVLVDRFKKRTIMLDKGYVIHDSNKGGYKSL